SAGHPPREPSAHVALRDAPAALPGALERAAEPQRDLLRPVEVGRDDADDLVAQFAQPVLPLLLPPDDLAGVFTRAHRAQVLALAVELPDRPLLLEVEVGSSDQPPVRRVELALQVGS